MEWVTLEDLNLKKKTRENGLCAAIELINLCIGIILTLICILIYIIIDSVLIRSLLIIAFIAFAAVVFVMLFKSTHKQVVYSPERIKNIALVNEDNEIIKQWEVEDKVSVLIGKKIANSDIDLSSSIYSNFIEAEHAVLNYAGGQWYVEDLSLNNGVTIQKKEDGIQYKVVKHSPCKIKKGDILFISKAKLLLRWNGVR